jgi:glycosyltransferase involved in cell wall biosynthesis
MGGISKSLLVYLEDLEIPLVYDVSDHWIARSLSGDVWLSWWNDPGSPLRHASRAVLKALGIRSRIESSVPTRTYRSLAFKRIYFCSEFLRQLTVDKDYPVPHGDVIYCSVESENFPVKREYVQPRRLLWVGRFAEDKDPLTAIEAMVMLKGGPLEACQLDLYGRGEEAYTSKMKNRVMEAGLSEKVNFCFSPHKELRSRFREYDALLFTSNWGEPFALTPLEAMAAGLPVLLSPDGGDRELGRDGENCLLIEAANPKSIVQALDRLSQLPDYGQAIAECARNELLERYDIQVIVSQIESYLMESL